MTAFSREASNKLQQFAPQNISNMLWAYATLGHSPGTTGYHNVPDLQPCFPRQLLTYTITRLLTHRLLTHRNV